MKTCDSSPGPGLKQVESSRVSFFSNESQVTDCSLKKSNIKSLFPPETLQSLYSKYTSPGIKRKSLALHAAFD